MTSYGALVQSVTMPQMVRVRQHFERPHIEDVEGKLREELERPEIQAMDFTGKRIAITCGSRGIHKAAEMQRQIVAICKERGAEPFIVPAMGSHGGATAEGQRQILTDLGVTEEFCGCPILSSMEVKKIGQTAKGQDVYIDKHAAEADGIILINRIKAHTEFRGPYESGLMKMMAIGLGKQYGAQVCHYAGCHRLNEMIPAFGNVILDNSPVMFGIGILENAYDETAEIHALTPDEIRSQEPILLEKAKAMMGKILLPHTDVLVVDEIGKNISGNGADPNVTGAFESNLQGGISAYKRVVLDIHPDSHGNGQGMGVFDTTTRRLVDKLDLEAAYTNAITSAVTQLPKIPMTMDNDHDAIAAAITTCIFAEDRENIKLIRIKNTMELGEIWVSEALLEEVKKNPLLEVLSEPEPFAFDEAGNLF